MTDGLLAVLLTIAPLMLIWAAGVFMGALGILLLQRWIRMEWRDSPPSFLPPDQQTVQQPGHSTRTIDERDEQEHGHEAGHHSPLVPVVPLPTLAGQPLDQRVQHDCQHDAARDENEPVEQHGESLVIDWDALARAVVRLAEPTP